MTPSPSAPASAATRARTGSPSAEPRYPFAWAAATYALATLVLGLPALAGKFLVNPMSDQYRTGYAYRELGTELLRAGDFAQWNPYILGGLPFIGPIGHGDIFYPTFLLRLVMPVDVALTWSFLIHLFLAGLFTFGLARAFGLRFFPSLVAGVAYMMSGQVASLVSPGHDGKTFVSALAPLLLWMILRAVRDGRRWAYGLIAITTGLAVLTPHMQMVYYLGVLSIAFVIWLTVAPSIRTVPRATAIRRALFAGGAAALGFGIAAAHMLPILSYLSFAARGEARGWEYATSWSMPPEEMIGLYLPHFSGLLESYWGRNPLKLHSEYIGASVLLLAGLAFANREWRPLVKFWVAVSAVATLVALGGHTPFYHLWYQLPMMKVVRAPAMVFYISTLGVALLAAVGTERALREGISRTYAMSWGAVAALILLLAGSGGLTAIGESVIARLPAEQVGGRYDLLRSNESAMVGGAVRSLLTVGLTLGVLLAAGARRLSASAAGGLLAAVVGLDLWSVERLFFRFSPPARELYASDPAIEYLQNVAEPGRTLAMALRREAVDPYLDGDGLVAHHVRAVSGHQGNELRRWVELAGAKSPVPPPNVFRREFRRLANVKYWLTDAELPPELPQVPGMKLTRRIGPVRNAAGNQIYLYELDEDNPAAWVAPVAVEAGPEAIAATMLDQRFDIRRAALFDSSAVIDGHQISTLPEPLPLRARVTRIVPGRISVTLDGPAPQGSALIVSENWYPGWSATVDGRAAVAERADYSLIGVPLPAGARGIELVFRDEGYRRGRWISVAALVIALAIVGIGARLDRREATA